CRPWDNIFDCRVLFRRKDIRGGRFVRPILIFRTKRYWILFRIGPKRRRKAEMPTDLCLFSNSPDPIVPVFGDHDLGWHGDRLIDFLDLIAT
uniref:Uncharacterized protein n=2 Tax=Aegilops tauschii subsp. strangulata TaxID=200361 RepID=A0A452XEP1_AEGTS